MIVLFAHVRTGRWASVMPARLAETLGLTETIRAIPIVEPEAVHTIGLVVPAREPMTPLTAALVAEARRLAQELDEVGPMQRVAAGKRRGRGRNSAVKVRARCSMAVMRIMLRCSRGGTATSTKKSKQHLQHFAIPCEVCELGAATIQEAR